MGTMGIRLSRIRIDGVLPITAYRMATAYGQGESLQFERKTWDPFNTTDLTYNILNSCAVAPEGDAYLKAPVHSVGVTFTLKTSNAANPAKARLIDQDNNPINDEEIETIDTVGEDFTLIGSGLWPHLVDGRECALGIIGTGGATATCTIARLKAWDGAVLPTGAASGWYPI